MDLPPGPGRLSVDQAVNGQAPLLEVVREESPRRSGRASRFRRRTGREAAGHRDHESACGRTRVWSACVLLERCASRSPDSHTTLFRVRRGGGGGGRGRGGGGGARATVGRSWSPTAKAGARASRWRWRAALGPKGEQHLQATATTLRLASRRVRSRAPSTTRPTPTKVITAFTTPYPITSLVTASAGNPSGNGPNAEVPCGPAIPGPARCSGS